MNEKADKDVQTAIHTCPMHPEVRQEGPGKCPECGMFLVPEGGAADDAGGCCGGKGHGHHAHDHSGGGAPGGKYDTVPTGWTGAVHTCPMHAEVRQTTPGDCPLCGMGLELDAAAGGAEGPNPELVDFTRRFWVATVLTVSLLVLAMSPYLGIDGIRGAFGEQGSM